MGEKQKTSILAGGCVRVIRFSYAGAVELLFTEIAKSATNAARIKNPSHVVKVGLNIDAHTSGALALTYLSDNLTVANTDPGAVIEGIKAGRNEYTNQEFCSLVNPVVTPLAVKSFNTFCPVKRKTKRIKADEVIAIKYDTDGIAEIINTYLNENAAELAYAKNPCVAAARFFCEPDKPHLFAVFAPRGTDLGFLNALNETNILNFEVARGMCCTEYKIAQILEKLT